MGAETVKVVVRCRPMNEKEKKDGRKEVCFVDSNRGEVKVVNPAGSEEPRVFTFDKTFGPQSTQRQVFEEVGRQQVDSVLEGFNATVFAYGQTGTGKTYTMEGQGDAETKGVIPNSFQRIFESIESDQSSREYLVKVSALEIYNEEIRDLLGRDPKAKLELREDKATGVYVQGLGSYVAGSPEDMFKFLEIGRKNRAVGATSMNAGSSRSHSIFLITIASSMADEKGNDHARVGKLNLVDLAGSERAGKTGAEAERFKEGVKINLSLTALGNVINALVERKPHIPYRESKLTRLLQDSLGGNTKTVMFAMLGPADWNYDETLSTLRYANRAKNIKNKPVVNEDPRDRTIREYQEEIARLRELLANYGDVPGQGGGPRMEKVSSDQFFAGWNGCQVLWFKMCMCCCMPPMHRVVPDVREGDDLNRMLDVPVDPDQPGDTQTPAERRKRLESLKSQYQRAHSLRSPASAE